MLPAAWAGANRPRKHIHEPIQKTAFIQCNGKIQGNASLLSETLHD
jgi:hypothetical protein